MADKKEKNHFTQLGMAGVAAAGIFVCVSLSPASSSSLKSIWWFSLSIPVIVAATFGKIFSAEVPKKMGELLLVVSEIMTGLGDIFSAIGFYWLIDHSSPDAARIFLQLSVALWFIVGSIGLWARMNKRGHDA